MVPRSYAGVNGRTVGAIRTASGVVADGPLGGVGFVGVLDGHLRPSHRISIGVVGALRHAVHLQGDLRRILRAEEGAVGLVVAEGQSRDQISTFVRFDEPSIVADLNQASDGIASSDGDRIGNDVLRRPIPGGHRPTGVAVTIELKNGLQNISRATALVLEGVKPEQALAAFCHGLRGNNPVGSEKGETRPPGPGGCTPSIRVSLRMNTLLRNEQFSSAVWEDEDQALVGLDNGSSIVDDPSIEAIQRSYGTARDTKKNQQESCLIHVGIS